MSRPVAAGRPALKTQEKAGLRSNIQELASERPTGVPHPALEASTGAPSRTSNDKYLESRTAAVSPSSLPLWFGPSARPLFGRVYLPSDDVARGGVLLCPPFDLEAQEVALAYQLLAEDLQERRFVVLHFDYDGTGDSAGGADDPDRVRAWQGSIVEAAKFLRSSGVGHVLVVGMRLGATLAASVAARSRG